MTELRLISQLARSLGPQTDFVVLISSQLLQSGAVEKKMELVQELMSGSILVLREELVWVSYIWCYARFHLALRHIVLCLLCLGVLVSEHPPPLPPPQTISVFFGLAFFSICTFFNDRVREYHSWDVICFKHFVHYILK